MSTVDGSIVLTDFERCAEPCRDVDADLGERRDRERVHDAGLCPGTLDADLLAEVRARQPLGHLAPRGIRNAEEEKPPHAASRAGSAGNQSRVRLQTAQTESITGTSTRTPTTVASAAPEPGP